MLLYMSQFPGSGQVAVHRTWSKYEESQLAGKGVGSIANRITGDPAGHALACGIGAPVGWRLRPR